MRVSIPIALISAYSPPSQDTPQATPESDARLAPIQPVFADRVWRVVESPQVEEGSVRIFLEGGTLATVEEILEASAVDVIIVNSRGAPTVDRGHITSRQTLRPSCAFGMGAYLLVQSLLARTNRSASSERTQDPAVRASRA